jgi:hypothetical protein
MAKKVIYNPDLEISYENLPDKTKLYFYNNMFTLSALPKNFVLINDPNPPITTVVEEQIETMSLEV